MDKRLLEDYAEPSDRCTGCYCQRGKARPSRMRQLKYLAVSFVVQMLILVFTLATLGGFLRWRSLDSHEVASSILDTTSSFNGGIPKMFSPFTTYEVQYTGADAWQTDLYFGPPRNESELAWNDLLVPRSFRLRGEETEALNITDGVRLKPDGKDYMSILGVKHNLHCLRSVRQYLYSDHYYQDVSQERLDFLRHHLFHCLESLRASVVCYPDLNPHPYYLIDRDWHQANADPKVTRQCVNWAPLQDELKKRHFEVNDIIKTFRSGNSD